MKLGERWLGIQGKEIKTMVDGAKHTGATVIPTVIYRDAPAAIDWLCEAFGFERQLVVESQDGRIVHAQLVYGNGMLMLGSERDDEFGRRQKSPKTLGGVGTQSSYVIVEDPDAHYARAVALGAEIVIEIRDEEHGGRGYSCADPEGQVWNFGSYDPWAEGQAAADHPTHRTGPPAG